MKYCATFRVGTLHLVAALLCLALLTNACTMKPLPVCHPNYFQATDKETIAGEIIRLKETIAENQENSGKTEPYLNLALLLAHYNNPAPDYHSSLLMLETYLSSGPHSKRKDEVLYLKTLMQGLVESDRQREQDKYDQKNLEEKIEKLQANNAKLVGENLNLQNAIEELKLLELRLEEQRMHFR